MQRHSPRRQKQTHKLLCAFYTIRALTLLDRHGIYVIRQTLADLAVSASLNTSMLVLTITLPSAFSLTNHHSTYGISMIYFRTSHASSHFPAPSYYDICASSTLLTSQSSRVPSTYIFICNTSCSTICYVIYMYYPWVNPSRVWVRVWVFDTRRKTRTLRVGTGFCRVGVRV
jgi:hypothetical protein